MQHDTHNDIDQSEVIRFLSEGAGQGVAAQRIDTHGAMIFLTGDLAFKIKRAVRYDYMDLSTVNRRRAMLEREFELNRDAAPSIYRDVRPVVRRADGTLALGGPGQPVEWVLSMNRFPPEAELSRIARTGGIDDALAEALGAAVAQYHARCPLAKADAADLMAEILDELDRVFAGMPADRRDRARDVLAHAHQVWQTRSGLLAGRGAAGHVRRCHGDLHLRNIVMIDGRPTPIDALEFDERLGTCDTLYDLAFLLMDLDHAGLPRPANRVLNAWLAASGGTDLSGAGLALLPLYLAVRALIRAMVDLQTAALGDPEGRLATDARAYLAQADRYLQPPPPVLVAIGGFSGTGKTTVARALAHRLGAAPGAVHIRSDVLRKTLLHRDPLEHLEAEGYSADMSARTYAAMRAQAAAVLDQGQCVILDAVHGTPDLREQAARTAQASGCRFAGFWLEAPTDTRIDRVGARGPDASDADAAVVTHQAASDPGAMNWHRLRTDRPVCDTVAAIVDLLACDVIAAGADGGRHVG